MTATCCSSVVAQSAGALAAVAGLRGGERVRELAAQRSSGSLIVPFTMPASDCADDDSTAARPGGRTPAGRWTDVVCASVYQV